MSLPVFVASVFAASGSTVPLADPSTPLCWPTPIVPQRADPQVFLHTDGWHYLTATVPEYDRIELRSDAGPSARRVKPPE
ncbi:MAG TPA: hypothetical protein VIM44_05815 [Rariglobus sp.]